MSNKITEDKTVTVVEEAKSQRQKELEELRKNRVAPGIPSKNLEYPSRPGYVRRVVCDRHGRLDKMLKGGWRFVTHDELEEANPAVIKATTREGVDSRVSQVVGSHKDNSVMHGYLMELPQELYDEDQAVKMQAVDELEDGLRQGMSADGSVKPGQDGMRVGSAGIKIERKRR